MIPVAATAAILAALAFWMAARRRQYLRRSEMWRRPGVLIGLNLMSQGQRDEWCAPVDMAAARAEMEAMEQEEKDALEERAADRRRLLAARPGRSSEIDDVEASPTSEDPDEADVQAMTAARRPRS